MFAFGLSGLVYLCAVIVVSFNIFGTAIDMMVAQNANLYNMQGSVLFPSEEPRSGIDS